MKTEAAKTARQIKKELKQAFPNTKFSVKSRNFSMGNAVDVEYMDGPTTDMVKAIVDKYQYGHFDGRIDMYEHSNSRADIPQVKYVQVRRIYSEVTVKVVVDYLQQNYNSAPACEVVVCDEDARAYPKWDDSDFEVKRLFTNYFREQVVNLDLSK